MEQEYLRCFSFIIIISSSIVVFIITFFCQFRAFEFHIPYSTFRIPNSVIPAFPTYPRETKLDSTTATEFYEGLYGNATALLGKTRKFNYFYVSINSNRRNTAPPALCCKTRVTFRVGSHIRRYVILFVILYATCFAEGSWSSSLSCRRSYAPVNVKPVGGGGEAGAGHKAGI